MDIKRGMPNTYKMVSDAKKWGEFIKRGDRKCLKGKILLCKKKYPFVKKK